MRALGEMPQEIRLGKVKEAIRRVAAERLSDARIVSVEVREDTDFDGDPIFVVTLVVDAAEHRLDRRRVSGLVRHIRSKLAEINEYSFPLVSFISKSDADASAA